MPAGYGGVAPANTTINGMFAPLTPNPLPTSQYGNPATFTAAANQQASDYDRIMSDYSNLAKNYAANPLTTTPVNYSPIAPNTPAPYQQSGDVTQSLSGLSELSRTGGLSGGQIADIRARDISPIRAIYANAQQNVERQRALAGGYSPNFNAVQAQMARDEANAIADKVTAVNAGIAEMQQKGKLSAAPSYASTALGASSQKQASDLATSDIINRTNLANAQNQLSTDTGNANRSLEAQQVNRGNILGSIQGQANLYGTTPALTATFGNQVATAAGLGQNQQQINNRQNEQLLDWLGRPTTRYGG